MHLVNGESFTISWQRQSLMLTRTSLSTLFMQSCDFTCYFVWCETWFLALREERSVEGV